MTPTADQNARPFAIAALVAALGFFAWLQVAALGRTGGVFEYPLDDVYIHLAMAEQMARGGYGVNAGEYASAASSAFYPVLLMPFAGTEAQRFLPLVWNIAGLVMAAVLWGRIIAFAGYGRAPGLALAIAGPVALNMSAVAFTGMEHALHTAASLAILYGLLRFAQDGTLRWVLVAGMVAAPLLRFEGLALALLSVGMLALNGRRGAAGWTGALVVLPIVGFCGFLLSLGLDPLPNSVQAKLVSAGEEEITLLQRILGTFQINIGKTPGFLVLCLAVLSLVATAVLPHLRKGPMRHLGLAVAGAAVAHLFLGQIGWMHRYETYILSVASAGLLVLVAPAFRGTAPASLLAFLALLPIAGAGAFYLPKIIRDFPANPRAIHLQQAQMARFAQDYAKVPVAVNDLGRVVWGNPDYVLDLWGLASTEARMTRLFNPVKGWAGPMAKAKGVPLAMIYDEWLGDAVGADWVRVGTLTMINPQGFLGSDKIAFYATAPEHVAGLIPALDAFVPTLPNDARFDFAKGIR